MYHLPSEPATLGRKMDYGCAELLQSPATLELSSQFLSFDKKDTDKAELKFASPLLVVE
jgi:hypothetical protein